MNNIEKEQFLNYAINFNSPNQQERKVAYDQIENLMKNYPAEYVNLSSQFLLEGQIQEGPTRIILTLLVRALKNDINISSGKSIWLNIDRQMKDQLLTCSFQVVLYPSASIKKQGADLISTIFCLDRLNEKHWPNIIDSISKNVGHEDKGVREAAIYSLSFICEYTQENKDIALSSQEIESLLSGIFNTLKSYSDLTLAAVDGLKFATDFVLQRMHDCPNLETADYVFNILIELLMNCKQAPRPDIDDLISGIIICLKDICEGFYSRLENYTTVIFDKVLTSLSFNPKIINSVFFFFQGIFEIEYIEQICYTNEIFDNVRKAVFEFLLTYEQLHYDDEGGASLTGAAYQLLNNINKIYIKSTIQDNLNFVYANIEISNINNLCAALIVFRSMIKHADQNVILEPLENGFQNFLGLLNNNQEAVITQTLQLFVDVSEHLPDVLYIQKNTDEILRVAKNIIKNPLNFSPRNFTQAFSILSHLTENIKNKTKNMTKHFRLQTKSLLEFICTIAFQTQDLVCLEHCFTFFFTVIEAEQDSSELINYFENFRTMLIQTAQNSTTGNELEQKIICLIEVILNVILLKIIGDENGRMKIKSKQDKCIELYEICQEQMNLQNDLIQEPFELMASVLLCNPDSIEFRQEVNKFIKDYIYQALRTQNQIELYSKGVGLYLSLLDQYKLKNDSDIEKVFKQLLDFLINKYTLTSGDQYTLLFRQLNDYIGYKTSIIDNNFEDLKEFLKMQMKQLVFLKLKQFKSVDLELITEMTYLICELQICILHSIDKDSYGYKNLQSFKDLTLIFVEFIIEYLKIIRNPGWEIAHQMLGIIIDYKVTVDQTYKVKQEVVYYLIKYIKQFQNREEIRELLDYIDKTVPVLQIENIN